jgi:hypothetical protein
MTKAALLVLSLTACARPPQQEPSVVPGVPVTFDMGRGADTVVFRRSITRAGQDTSAGTRTVVLQVVPGPNRVALLEVEQRFPGGGGTIVDTAIAELHTLRAVAHRSHQPTRTMRFDFTATDAVGVVTTAFPDSTPRVDTVRQSLGGRIFDSNVLDLVIAALPLRPEFTTDLPFFIYERGGRVPMPVAVRERATIDFPVVGPRAAWVVSVGVPGAPATIWVDTETRAVLRTRYDITARSLSFTDDRITPLHDPA